jgi:hypothetical protein
VKEAVTMHGARKETTPVTVDSPVYEARWVEMGEFTAAFETVRLDHDASPMFKGLPDDSCQCPHWGVMISGRMTLHYRDHDDTFEAGDVFYCPPGHIPGETQPGTEFITFSPTKELREVMAVVGRNLVS